MNASGVERSVPFEFLDTTGRPINSERRKRPEFNEGSGSYLVDFDPIRERFEVGSIPCV